MISDRSRPGCFRVLRGSFFRFGLPAHKVKRTSPPLWPMTGSICMFPESFIAFQFGPLLKRGPDETHGLAVAIAAVILIGEHFTEPVVRSLRKSAQSPLCPFQRLLEIT